MEAYIVKEKALLSFLKEGRGGLMKARPSTAYVQML